jgi:hypothetical protein
VQAAVGVELLVEELVPENKEELLQAEGAMNEEQLVQHDTEEPVNHNIGKCRKSNSSGIGCFDAAYCCLTV